jgi:hypothetical protein
VESDESDISYLNQKENGCVHNAALEAQI